MAVSRRYTLPPCRETINKVVIFSSPERFSFEKKKREASSATRPEISGKARFFRKTTGHIV